MSAKRAAKKAPKGDGSTDDEGVDGRGVDGRGVDGDAVGFDERLDELETIVAELENGDLSLEESIGRYTSGIELLKGCHQLLSTHRRRVEELTRDAERSLAAFDEDPDFQAPGAYPGGTAPEGRQ